MRKVVVFISFLGVCVNIKSQITGVVTDESGNPIQDAWVYVYGTNIFTKTDNSGYYSLSLVSPAAPRYIVVAEKEGYFIAREGDVDIPSTVNLVLEEKNLAHSYKTQILDCRLCYLIDHKKIDSIPKEPSPDAVLDTTLYPSFVKPYLESGKYMDKDNSDIQVLAQEILYSIPESDKTKQTEVAKAVYLWVVKNINYDLMNRYPGDVTCGNWQTVNGGWGKNFADWCYLPSEVIEGGRAICIEYERFTATLLRALSIPARPAPLGAHPVTQWWVQLPDGSGYWANMETSRGHLYYEEGDTLACFPSQPDSKIAFYSPNADAPIHNDWDLNNPCLWREVTEAGGVKLKHTQEELSIAQQLVGEFENTGKIEYYAEPPPPNEPYYEVWSRGFQVDLSTLKDQKSMILSFPLFINNEYNQTIDYAFFINHPEWVKRKWIDTLKDGRTGVKLPMFYAEVEFKPISFKDITLKNPSFEEGETLPSEWETFSTGGISEFSLSSDALEGEHSGYIRRESQGVSYFYQSFPVEEGDVIRIDGWIKLNNVEASVTINCIFYGDYDNPPPYPGTYPRLSGTQGWTKVWGSFYAPLNTDSAKIACTIVGEGEVWFDDLKITVSHGSETGIKENIKEKGLELMVYPNLFKSSVVINYRLKEKGNAEINIYDVTGKVVKTFINNSCKPGNYRIVWDGRDESGKEVPSGIYFCRFKTQNVSMQEKIIKLLR